MKRKNPIQSTLTVIFIAGVLISALGGCSPAEPKAVATPDKAAGKDVEDNKSVMPGKGVDKDK